MKRVLFSREMLARTLQGVSCLARTLHTVGGTAQTWHGYCIRAHRRPIVDNLKLF